MEKLYYNRLIEHLHLARKKTPKQREERMKFISLIYQLNEFALCERARKKETELTQLKAY